MVVLGFKGSEGVACISNTMPPITTGSPSSSCFPCPPFIKTFKTETTVITKSSRHVSLPEHASRDRKTLKHEKENKGNEII